MKDHRKRQIARDMTRLSKEMADLQEQLARLQQEAKADAEAIAEAARRDRDTKEQLP